MTRARPDDPDMSLEDLLTLWPETVPVFHRHGMLCPRCPVTRFFTCAEACAEYGLDADAFMAELKAAISLARRPPR